MRNRIILVVVIVVLAVAGYFTYRYISINGGLPSTANALGGSGTIETVQLAITPQTSGRIIVAPTDEGIAVRRGDLLYRLDPVTARLQIQQARSGVSAAAANYKYVKHHSGSTSADKASAKAQLQQAEVALRMAQVQATYTVIAAPIDGVVTNIAAHAGENAVPGSTLCIVSNPTSLTVTIYVPETQIGQVHLGQPGTLVTDSNQSYNCVVDFVASQAEFTPASIETKDQRVKLVYQVQLRITNPNRSLKAGMPVDVTLK